MLKLSSTLLNIPIMGLQEAAAIGTAVRPLVNPNNLKIEGWFCTQPASKDVLFLPASDIREIARYGLAVNSRQELAPALGVPLPLGLRREPFPLLFFAFGFGSG